MRKDWDLSQEAFDRLLGWLAPERERAGQTYEKIRRRLIEIFASRGCRDAEDLSDETINRVTLKLPGLSEGYVGDPALYFYGVAQKVYLESLRRKPLPLPLPTVTPASPVPPAHDEGREADLECLAECLRKLPSARRDLFLRYYADDEKGRDRRKELAGSLGVSFNALRIRAHRIREELRECVRECLAGAGAGK